MHIIDISNYKFFLSIIVTAPAIEQLKEKYDIDAEEEDTAEDNVCHDNASVALDFEQDARGSSTAIHEIDNIETFLSPADESDHFSCKEADNPRRTNTFSSSDDMTGPFVQPDIDYDEMEHSPKVKSIIPEPTIACPFIQPDLDYEDLEVQGEINAANDREGDNLFVSVGNLNMNVAGDPTGSTLDSIVSKPNSAGNSFECPNVNNSMDTTTNIPHKLPHPDHTSLEHQNVQEIVDTNPLDLDLNKCDLIDSNNDSSALHCKPNLHANAEFEDPSSESDITPAISSAIMESNDMASGVSDILNNVRDALDVSFETSSDIMSDACNQSMQ